MRLTFSLALQNLSNNLHTFSQMSNPMKRMDVIHMRRMYSRIRITTINNIISLQFTAFPCKFDSPQVNRNLASSMINSV